MLADDIREHGLLQPIVVHRGEVLDGRNRLAACALAGVEPRFVDWKSNGAPVAWIAGMNLHRRHLSPSQRAAFATAFLPLLETEAAERQKTGLRPGPKNGDHTKKPNGYAVRAKLPQGQRAERPRDVAAKAAGVSPRQIQDAKTLQRTAPAAFEDVKAGKTTLGAALKAAKKPVPPVAAAKPEAPPLDALGREIPPALLPAFEIVAPAIKRVRLALLGAGKEWAALMEELAALDQVPLAGNMEFQAIRKAVEEDLAHLITRLHRSYPYTACVYCKGRVKDCRGCRGAGWITKEQFDTAPEDIKPTASDPFRLIVT